MFLKFASILIILVWLLLFFLAHTSYAKPKDVLRNTYHASNAGLQTERAQLQKRAVTAPDILLVSTLDGSLHALNPLVGERLWTLKANKNHRFSTSNVPIYSELRSRQTPNGNDMVEWGTLGLDGYEEEDLLEPINADNVLYVVEPIGDGTLYSWTAETGMKKLPFSVKEIINASPLNLDGIQYTGSKNSIYMYIDPLSGKVLQEVGVDFSPNECASREDWPAMTIVLAKTEYKLRIIDAETLTEKWRMSYIQYVPDDPFYDSEFSQISTNGIYSTLNHEGHISALDIINGRGLWTHDQLDFPAIEVFNVYEQVSRSGKPKLVVAKPPIPSIREDSSWGRMLAKARAKAKVASASAYVGVFNHSSLYAMSSENYPFIDLAWDNPRSRGNQWIDAPTRRETDDFSSKDDDVNEDHLYSGPCGPNSPEFPQCVSGIYLIEAADMNGLGTTDLISTIRSLRNNGASTPQNTINPTEIPAAWIEAGSATENNDSFKKTKIIVDVPMPSWFWYDGPGRFWKLYLLILGVLGYYFRERVKQRKVAMELVLSKWWKSILLMFRDVLIPELQRLMVSRDELTLLDELAQNSSGGKKKKKKSIQSKERGKGIAVDKTDDNESDDYLKTTKKRVGFNEDQNVIVSDETNTTIVAASDDFSEVVAQRAGVAPLDGVLKLNTLTISMKDILGFGSHGTVVYKGTFGGREVAVKRLLHTFYDIAEHEVQLLQESDDHPNVVRYYCQEQHDQFMYIALELCQSSLYDAIESPLSSLASLLASTNPARILYQIIAGIHHLHSLKIVHRDIKPQNILITSAKPRYSRKSGYGKSSQRHDDIRVLISDFGLCKKLETDQSSFNNTTANAAGTIGWRAPELLSSLNEEQPVLVDINSSMDTTSSSLNQSTGTPTRITRAIDIFSTGCLFYYVLSKGDHPFGDRFSREINILKGISSLEKLSSMGEEGVEAKDLIERMISSDPRCRPSAEDIMLHPYFWTPSQRLAFLQDASDRFEIESRDPPSPLIQKLEYNANNVIGPDWYKRIDRVLVNDLSKFRKYDGKKVRDLLRALRNKKHHWQDLSEPLKRALGEPPDGYLYYFTSRFPKLLLHVYYVVVEDEELRTGNMFKSYFALPPGV